MIFSSPKPFREAMQANQVRQLLPTDLSSAMLAEIDPQILAHSRFSAKVTSVDHLDVIDHFVNKLTDGKTDLATARLGIKQFLADTGYEPDPALKGTLQDFSSDLRTNLQLRINVQQAQGYGWWKQGQDPDLLDAYPAQEFLRVEAREKERSDWPQRWQAAGGQIFEGGRMIALKNDPVWETLSRFGLPYPPFDFGSGMGVEDISRKEAEALGLISPGETLEPEDLGFDDDLAAPLAGISQTIRAALELTGIGKFDKLGVFRALLQ